jgi:hypothetical protein
MSGVSLNTVTKLLVDLGTVCSIHQDHAMRNLGCERLQVDEIWSFVYSKQKNVPRDKRGEARYSPWVCQRLEGWLRGKNVPTRYLFAASTLTFLHELVHARGVRDESVADCTALREMPGVLGRYFGVKRATTLRALMALAWQEHRLKPASYQTVC